MNLIILVFGLSLAASIESVGVKKFVTFEFISENYQVDTYTIDNFQDILNNPKFDQQKRTAIYSYGFTQTVYQPSVREIVDAYLTNGDFNFVLVNYNSIVAYNVLSVNEFADGIAESLIKLFEGGYGNFHLIGFSLGGQISGAIGRRVIEKSQQRFKIPRITGLDPGSIPTFFKAILQDLNSGDAEFVDTIHGESKYFGSSSAVGDASFWINGGYSQPSCQSFITILTSICSHLMTPKFWAESVRSKNPQRFPAVQCENYETFKLGSCGITPNGFMGLYADSSSTGHFYLDAKLESA